MDVEAALKAIGRILEGCTAEKQPSEALLNTLVKLLGLSQAPTEGQIAELLVRIPQIEDRMRRLELNAGVASMKRPTREKAQRFLNALTGTEGE